MTQSFGFGAPTFTDTDAGGLTVGVVAGPQVEASSELPAAIVSIATLGEPVSATVTAALEPKPLFRPPVKNAEESTMIRAVGSR